MKKLITIQNELKAPKNQFNSFGKYNYRSCEDILEALKPLLSKYECLLTLSDETKEIGGIIYVEATATITDGETLVVTKSQAGIDINKKGMDMSQCFGSSSSYARKYALNSLFLIDDTKDADTTNEHDKSTSPLIEKYKKALSQVNSLEMLNDLYIANSKEITAEIKNLFTQKKSELNG